MPQIMLLWKPNIMMTVDKHKVEVNMIWLTLKCMIHNVHTDRQRLVPPINQI